MKGLFGKILIILFVLGALSVLFFTWYISKHSMDEAKAFEINTLQEAKHILMATQGSKFKDAVVQEVIKKLLPKTPYISVIDVSHLASVREEDWDALVILHTWEYDEPPRHVKSFIDKLSSKSKLVIVSTSGSGNYLMKDVDGITSASQLEEVNEKANEIVSRLAVILGNPE